MISEVLMILQPRVIPEAIESLNNLNIEKVWFRGYTEKELEVHLNRFIQETDYDVYWIIADDVLVDERPLQILRPLLNDSDVVTGYCRLYQESDLVNISTRKIKSGHIKGHPSLGGMFNYRKRAEKHGIVDEQFRGVLIDDDFIPAWVNYGGHDEDKGGFMRIQEVEETEGAFRTYFAGWSFTGMRREVWLRHPFQVDYTGSCSDAQFAFRYVHNDDGIILTHKDAYFHHLKEKDATLKRDWIVGVDEPIIHFGKGATSLSEVPSESVWFKGLGDLDDE